MESVKANAMQLAKRATSGKSEREANAVPSKAYRAHAVLGVAFEIRDRSGKLIYTVEYPDRFGKSLRQTATAVPSSNARAVAAAKRVFDSLRQGKNLWTITDELNRSKFPTYHHGKAFGYEYVRGMVRNRIYVDAGIVSADESRSAQEMLNTHPKQRRSPPEPGRFLLSGLLVCGDCERPIYGTGQHDRPGRKGRAGYSSLSSKPKSHRTCRRLFIGRDAIEEFVLKVTRENGLLAIRNADRVTTANRLSQVIDRIRLWAGPEVNRGKTARQRHGVIHFKDSANNPPRRFDEADLFPNRRWRRVAEIVHKTAPLPIRLSEIGNKMGYDCGSDVWKAVKEAMREGVVQRHSSGGYIASKPSARKKSTPAVARVVVKTAARRSRKSTRSTAPGKLTQNGSVRTATRRSPFPGLEIDETKRTITGANGKIVELDRSAVQWYILFAHWNANGIAVKPKDLRKDYPGDWGTGASFYVQKARLNEKLAGLGYQIADGLLKQLETAPLC